MKKRKRTKKIAIICLALVVAVVTAVVTTQLIYKPQTVLATELKLETYDSLDGVSIEDLTSLNGVQQYIIPIIEGSLSAAGYTLAATEKQALVEDITTRLKAEVEAGNIECDDAGNLTDLSKGYISNAVSDAVSYVLPTIDMESPITGGSDYSQIINMQKTLKALEESDESLIAMIQTVNDALKNTTSAQQAQIDTIDATLTDKMNALYTELLVKNTYNTKTGERLSSDVRDIQDIIIDLSTTQQQIVTKLDVAMARLETLAVNIDTLQSSNDSLQMSFDDISAEIEEIRLELTTNRQELADFQDKTTSSLTNQFNTQIASLTSSMNSGLDILANQLSTRVQEIRTSIDASNTTAAANLTKTQTELTEKIELTRTELNTLISTESARLNDELASTKSDLQTEIDQKYLELTSKDNEIEAKMAADKSELEKEIDNLESELATEIENKYTELSDTMNAKFEELAATDTELAMAIETTKNDLTTALETAKQNLSNDIEVAKSETNSKIDEVNTAVNNKIDDTTETLNNKIDASNETLNSKVDDAITTHDTQVQELWGQVNTNTSDVSDLQSRLNTFVLSADTHYKVDVIPGQTIKTDSWKTDGDNVTYTIKHKYAKNAAVVELDYAQQYDITPSYAVNDKTGEITITIPATQKQDVVLTDIICYHVVEDDTWEDSSAQESNDLLNTVADDATVANPTEE